MFDAISFPGGGNRCYWQGGFFEALNEQFDLAPTLVVGVSAGAFAGIYSLLGLGARVRELVFSGCGPHLKNFDLAGWRRGGPLYRVGAMYRALIAEVFDATALAKLNATVDFRLAIGRLPRGLPPVLGAALGVGTYQVEKHLFGPVHPTFGHRLGFRRNSSPYATCAPPTTLSTR
jgi:predicted acylesterase/phospholipase RssA